MLSEERAQVTGREPCGCSLLKERSSQLILNPLVCTTMSFFVVVVLLVLGVESWSSYTLRKHSPSELHLQAQSAFWFLPVWAMSRTTPLGNGVPRWAACPCQCRRASLGSYIPRCFPTIRKSTSKFPPTPYPDPVSLFGFYGDPVLACEQQQCFWMPDLTADGSKSLCVSVLMLLLT